MSGPRTAWLVFGPESSGTKLVARLITQGLGLSGADDWDGNDSIEGSTNIVMHRSLPHGGRGLGERGDYPDVIGVARDLEERGWRVNPILMIRDPEIAARSKARIHTHGDLQRARSEMAQARPRILDILADLPGVALVSYEALCYLGNSYLRYALVDFGWGAPDDRLKWDQRSANLKYLREIEEEEE